MSGPKPFPAPSLLIGSLVFVVIIPQIGLGMTTPMLPAIAHDLETSLPAAQGTLVAYMLGYAVSVLCAGILSDRYGPIRVQIVGLSIGSLAAVLSGFAADIHVFQACRFLQALGACTSTVTTRLIINTALTPDRRIPALTTLTSALAITPCIAPLAGSLLMPLLGWRGVLAVIAVLSCLALVLFFRATREMAATGKKHENSIQIFRLYAGALKNGTFRFHASTISLAWMSYFSFVACSAGPLQQNLGFTPVEYGLTLGMASLGYVCGSQTTRQLSRRLHPARIIRRAAIMGFSSGLMLILHGLAPLPSIIPSLLLLLPLLFATGMIMPATQAGMLENTPEHTGVISGFFFFLQMLGGAFYAGVGNLLFSLSPEELFMFSALPFVILPVVLRWTKG